MRAPSEAPRGDHTPAAEQRDSRSAAQPCREMAACRNLSRLAPPTTVSTIRSLSCPQEIFRRGIMRSLNADIGNNRTNISQHMLSLLLIRKQSTAQYRPRPRPMGMAAQATAAARASLRCLVLNASMEPISVVSAQRGLVLLLKERAMMLERAQVCLPHRIARGRAIEPSGFLSRLHSHNQGSCARAYILVLMQCYCDPVAGGGME